MCEDANLKRRDPLRRQTVLPAAALVVVLALSLALLGTGCSTTKGAPSRRMAWIVVTNQSTERIDAAIQSVFKNNAFEEGRSEGDEWVFQKPGSVMSGLVYGDWYSGGVWERIKIYQRELDSARTVVECDGYMVQQHEDPLFQKEKREYGTKKGHLRKLLEEVARELNTPAANAPPPQTK